MSSMPSAQIRRGLVPAERSAVVLSNLPHATVSLPVCPACEACVLDLLTLADPGAVSHPVRPALCQSHSAVSAHKSVLSASGGGGVQQA